MTIPQDLQEMFHIAVLEFQNWDDKRVPFEIHYQRRSHSVESICDAVSTYDDDLPQDVLQRLLGYMHSEPDLQQDLGRSRKYASAARCFSIFHQGTENKLGAWNERGTEARRHYFSPQLFPPIGPAGK